MNELYFRRQCEEVKRLGDQIGYGNMMTIASHLWAKMLVDEGLPDTGAFYPTIISNMRDTELTEIQKKERDAYLRMFEKWEW